MTRVVLPLVAALLGLGAVAAGVFLVILGGEPKAGPDVFVNPPGPIDANNTPTLARNPTDPENMVIAARRDRPQFTARLYWTEDGGRRWQVTKLPLPEDRNRAYAPDVGFGPDGTLYVSYVNLTGQGNTPETLWVARSDDGGRTLSNPDRAAGELTLQARLAVGPGGDLYLTWLQATDVGTLSLNGPAEIVAARSTDGGRTFSEPVTVSDSERQRVGAATPVVDGDGDLVVLYKDFRGNVRDFQNLDGPPWDGNEALVLTRSEDGAESFARGIEVDEELVPGERFLVFLPAFPSLAAGDDGTLYAVWAGARHGDDDVFLRRSDDGGKEWTKARRLNNEAKGDGTDQTMPQVAVAPDGRVDVAYLDSEDPDGARTHARLATSRDGGATFTRLTVSDEPFDARIGPSAAPHLPPDLGSRIGLDSRGWGARAVWTDTRMGSEADGRQDIATSRVALPDPAARWWGGVLAVALLLAAIAALAGWRRAGAQQIGQAESGGEGE